MQKRFLALMFVAATYASAGVFTFSNTTVISVPDFGEATPFPSNITASGVTGTVTKVVVQVSGINHTFSGDLNFLLVGPTGATAILMQDVNSASLSNVDLTFDDAASGFVPSSGAIVSGTYLPTALGNEETYTGAPAGPYAALLSSFNNLNANGTWALYVKDDAGSDQGTIAGWNLTITTDSVAAPEPSTLLTMAGGLGLLFLARRRRA